MQIKKDEIKRRLLHAGLQEFLNKGFEKASVRSIVKAANTTIGNFYNYFESKETLFSALVDNVYQQFVYIIKHHHELSTSTELIQTEDVGLWREKVADLIHQLNPIFNDRFLLLMEHSEGTKYSGAKQQLIQLIGHNATVHIKDLSPDYPYPELGHILAAQHVCGTIEIIKLIKDEQKREQLIIEQIISTAIMLMNIVKGQPT